LEKDVDLQNLQSSPKAGKYYNSEEVSSNQNGDMSMFVCDLPAQGGPDVGRTKKFCMSGIVRKGGYGDTSKLPFGWNIVL